MSADICVGVELPLPILLLLADERGVILPFDTMLFTGVASFAATLSRGDPTFGVEEDLVGSWTPLGDALLIDAARRGAGEDFREVVDAGRRGMRGLGGGEVRFARSLEDIFTTYSTYATSS